MGDSNIGWTQKVWWTADLIARFWSYVRVGDANECWEWIGGRFADGLRYGQFRVGPFKVKAHRAAFFLTVGEIPSGMRVLHRCDNPICCNSRRCHWLGTDADNARDRNEKGRTKPGVNFPDRSGRNNAAAKLTAATVAEIRALAGQQSRRSLADQFGVSPSQIGNIIHGRSWA